MRKGCAFTVPRLLNTGLIQKTGAVPAGFLFFTIRQYVRPVQEKQCVILSTAHEKRGIHMGTKRPTNENIHIGDMFKEHSATSAAARFIRWWLVELRPIRRENFKDDTCNLGLSQVRARPLPGQLLKMRRS